MSGDYTPDTNAVRQGDDLEQALIRMPGDPALQMNLRARRRLAERRQGDDRDARRLSPPQAVMVTYLHVVSPDCWCHPTEDEPGVFVHQHVDDGQ